MRFGCIVAVGVFAIGAMAAAQPDLDLDTERLNREARTLFAQVMRDNIVPQQACELDSDWSSQSIPFEVARRVFALQAFADLRSPSKVAPPPDVIAGVPHEVWCSGDEWTQYQATHAAAQAAALRALPKGADPEPLWWRSQAFSFPIFDQAYDRAVVVHESSLWRAYVVDTKGTVMRSAPEGGGYALVYERKSGIWKKVDEIELFTAD